MDGEALFWLELALALPALVAALALKPHQHADAQRGGGSGDSKGSSHPYLPARTNADAAFTG